MAGLQVAKVAVDKPVDKELGRFLDDGQIGKIETVQQTVHCSDSILRTVQLQTDSPT
jgi:hypothetical protein